MQRLFTLRHLAWILVITVQCGIPALCHATDDEYTVYQGDTILVEGDVLEDGEWVLRHPAFAVVRDLDDATEHLTTIADILEETAGVRIHRYGGIGAFATASIRGSSPGQVEVYLDGIPLNSSQWGITNLSELPVDNLARIEIFRSGAPVQFGTPGIGGVVHLVSRPAGEGRSIASLTAGSYGTWKGSLLRSGCVGNFGYLLSWHHMQTKGDFEFLYDPGTSVFNEEDDTLMTRGNNTFREHTLFTKITAPPIAGWRLTLQDNWYLKKSGLPGHGNLIYDKAHFDNRRHMTALNAASPVWFSRRLRAETTAWHLDRRDRYYNPGNESTLNRTDYIHRSETDGVRGYLTAYWFEAFHTFRLEAEMKRERFTPEDSHPQIGTGYKRERRSMNLGIEREITLWNDRLVYVDSYRYQEARDNFHGTNPYHPNPRPIEEPHWSEHHGPVFGLLLRPLPFLSIQGNRMSYARFPTLFELFGTASRGGMSDVSANPDLVPETGVTWDGGFRVAIPDGNRWSGSIEVSAFHSKRDSLICFVQNSQGNFSAKNLEEATAKGLEIHMETEPCRFLRIDGSFTTQDVRHEGGVPHWRDKWIPYVSPRELFLRTSVLWKHLSLRHEQNWFDAYFQDRYNSPEYRTAPRHYHNLGATIRVPRAHLTFDFEIKNITDIKSSDVYGYPMPGRTIYMTVELDFPDEAI